MLSDEAFALVPLVRTRLTLLVVTIRSTFMPVIMLVWIYISMCSSFYKLFYYSNYRSKIVVEGIQKKKKNIPISNWLFPGSSALLYNCYFRAFCASNVFPITIPWTLLSLGKNVPFLLFSCFLSWSMHHNVFCCWVTTMDHIRSFCVFCFCKNDIFFHGLCHAWRWLSYTYFLVDHS